MVLWMHHPNLEHHHWSHHNPHLHLEQWTCMCLQMPRPKQETILPSTTTHYQFFPTWLHSCYQRIPGWYTFIINTSFAKITSSPDITPNYITECHIMHHGTQCSTPLPITAQAICDGHTILATDGSVKNNVATNAWIISTTNDTIEQDITGGGLLLPPSAPYAWHALK